MLLNYNSKISSFPPWRTWSNIWPIYLLTNSHQLHKLPHYVNTHYSFYKKKNKNALTTTIHHETLEMTNKAFTFWGKIMLHVAFHLTSSHFQMAHQPWFPNVSSLIWASLISTHSSWVQRKRPGEDGRRILYHWATWETKGEFRLK